MKLRAISRHFESSAFAGVRASRKDVAKDLKKEITVKTDDLRNGYHVREELGRGKFGVVHKVINKEDGGIYAAKFIKVSESKRNEVLREVEIMKKLNHENLISLTDVYDMKTRIVVIMEFISGGELFERVVEDDNLTESEAAIYMKQILEGLKHMHQQYIVHLDLKPENVVCVQPRSTKIKLIDFGLARQLEQGKETKITCGTPEFVAPEVLNYDPVTLASDMWSVGVIAYILISGLSPFLGDTDTETFANVSSCEWDFDDECFDEVSKESKDFIEGLIISNPRDRRNVDLCLEHDWIQNHSFKKKRKLKIDNLRKFLAKKRWQKSVNAVRAVRRLSSFGASLLGKSSSLLRDKPKLGSLDSPTLSISEDGEGSNVGKKVSDSQEKKCVSIGSSESKGKIDIAKLIVNSPEKDANANEADNLNESTVQSNENKSSGKKSDENDSSHSLANISQLRQKFETATGTFRNSRTCNTRSRSNSWDWDRKSEKDKNDKKEAKPNIDNVNSTGFSSNGTKIDEGERFWKGRSEKNTMSLGRKFRMADAMANLLAAEKSKEKASSIETSRIGSSWSTKVPSGNDALAKDFAMPTKERKCLNDKSDVLKDPVSKRKAIMTEESPVRKAVIKENPPSKIGNLPKNDSHNRKGTLLNEEILKEESVSSQRHHKEKVIEQQSKQRQSECQVSDTVLERGNADHKPPSEPIIVNREIFKKNGETISENASVVSARKLLERSKAEGLQSSKKLQEDLSTEVGLRSYLERMIKEGKLPGGQVDIEMPHKKSWAKSSAADKRASFRELLSKSIAAEDVEESGGSEDEEPIKITARKEKFEDFYEDIEEIGKGRFGVVSKVRERSTGKYYAAKYIKVRAATRSLVRQEIDLLCAVRHRRIVKLYDVFEESRKFILLMEWVAGGELFEKLSREEIISEAEAVFFVRQILQGVRCMHRKGILHLDLKPENVMLVDPDSTDIKIIDFGLAKKHDPKDDIKVLSGTPAFAAPEVINFEKITKATDMWSVGVIAYVLLSGVSPFSGDSHQETCSNVTKATWDFDHEAFESVSEEAKDFISNLVIKPPKQRMSVEESIDHPWIKNARKRRESQIKTRGLFHFTKSFSNSAEFQDDVFTDNPVPLPETNIRHGASGITRDAKTPFGGRTCKQPVFEVINTMDESTTDSPPPGSPNGLKNKEEYRVLEERFKNMERGYNEMKQRLRKHSELQNEMENLRSELEKSLSAHQKLQESLLVHEKTKDEITERHDLLRNKSNKLESENKVLVQNLEMVNESYEKLSRKYKRLQEKLEKNEDLEDKIEELERTKARKLEKIRELEDLVADLNENKRRSNKGDETMRNRLEKENRSLQNTIENCHQEIEELEDKLGNLETENGKLRSELKQWRSSGNIDNNNKVDHKSREMVEKLETLKLDLEEQIEIEIRDRKLAEKERDTIEEEFAEERSSLESRIQKIMSHNRQLEDEIREMTCLLDASKKSYFQLDEEFQELKKEANFDKRKHKEEMRSKNDEVAEISKEKDVLKIECSRLDKKMAESIEEIRRLEKDHTTGRSTIDRKSSGPKDLERVREDLKMTQEHLRIATDTNSLLQLEIKKMKQDHETELNIQLIELEAKLSKGHEGEINRIREELSSLPNIERKELEDRITVQDFAIRKLQAILEVREHEERTHEETQEIAPVTLNGSESPTTNSNKASKFSQNLPDSVNVIISGGNEVKVTQSIDHDDEEDPEEKETLTDRELRRVSYKIAGGAWNNMGQALCLRGPKYDEIMNSNNNDQEKIFGLLSLWKSEMKQPRSVMISQLTVAIERMKRRDIVKFVKELNGREGSSLSIRKRIRNFVR
ncbi:uncharacterized protein LOC135689975 isoform X1 [Rhopilema esculentum]|uniref:uncharacterized protein LOC135689975 isoform X1 n=1 Tax=Rhopilema esculentum TaxID=499914 RepID=UPI0031DC81EC